MVEETPKPTVELRHPVTVLLTPLNRHCLNWHPTPTLCPLMQPSVTPEPPGENLRPSVLVGVYP
jgi:hypothetical protein